MIRYGIKAFGSRKKTLAVDKFSGLHAGSLQRGALQTADNVHILEGGALCSLLAERKVQFATQTALAPGVYTLADEYDARYEIPVDVSWIYANICPEDVLLYAKGLDQTSRILVADVGMPGRTENGYRNILGAFADGGKVYVLYDAVYNIIDQRRTYEYSSDGKYIVVQFYSQLNENVGTRCTIYTLTQLWMDEIAPDGSITATMVTAALKRHKEVPTSQTKHTLVSEDKQTFRYISGDYLPPISGSGSPDSAYEKHYPDLATYSAASAVSQEMRRIVRYCNRASEDAGEKLLLLPDMRLCTAESGAWRLGEKEETIPTMTAAVQHLERLFGISGSRLYASVRGDCTDYTEGVDHQPSSAAWQTVTADTGGFTAITSFDRRVMVFTKTSMMTVTGTDLPFALSYVGAYGCASQAAIAACGSWLYFASDSGILRYNGSRVEHISSALPCGMPYAEAKLTTADNLLVVYFGDGNGLYFYDPASEQWTHRSGDFSAIRFPDGSGEILFRQGEGGFLPYQLFADGGEFAFSVLLGCGERCRIFAVTVTASLADGAELCLADDAGTPLLSMQGGGKPITRTAAVRKMCDDGDALHFTGSGNVTVYCIRVQYTVPDAVWRPIR